MGSPRLSVLLLVGALGVGCGAKTGLDVPDAQVDGGPDGGMVVDADIPCVEVLPDAGPIILPLETEAEVGRADVLFLIDTTASMQEEIDGIRDSLRDRLAPAIESELVDTRIGVATYADFPVGDYGDPSQGDLPFQLILPMTDDLARVQAGIGSIRLGNGKDEPESQVEGLYQSVTGEGLLPWVPPSFGCPMGGIGYLCFREDALAVILLFTDAPFHNGPGGSNPYRGVSPTPHTYEQALEEIERIDARVIGFDSGDGAGAGDLAVIARDTRALDVAGNPLVFDIGRRGERVGTGVVGAIRLFAEAVVFDIDAIALDPDRSDGVDVTMFVEAIVPLRAEPPEGAASIDREAGVFRGVVSGTTVIFELRLRNEAIMPGPTARRFMLEVVFRGDGRTRLARRLVEIVIPGADGTGCDVVR